MKSFQGWYGGLAERERQLLSVLGVVAVLLVALGLPYVATWSMSSKKELNDSLREAIRDVQASRGKLDRANAAKRALDQRYAKPAPALAGFIENAARKSGLEIPESQDRAPIPHGKQFKERSTVVRLRKVSMLALVNTLQTIESSGYPVILSRLNIRKRGSQPDNYDVEMGVSAYDRAAAKPKKHPSTPTADKETP